MKEIITGVHNKLLSFYLFFLVLILWEIVPRLGWTSDVFLPPFSRIIQTGIDLGLFNVLIYVAISLKRVFVGFLLGTFLSLPLGFILAGALPWLSRFLRPLTVFLSSIPPFILFPIFVIISGIGEGGIYTVIFWSSFWPILFTTIVGIENVDPLLVRAAKSMNASKLQIFYKVVLPGASPTIITGVRTGLTMSFFMLIGAESMGADSGLGWVIHNAQNMGFVERIYLGAILVAGVGLLLNYALEYLEKTVLYWREAP
ncbi:binding-protein-dependent transport systems inner membrane component [Syntrophobotulus glycolicus DSM 8271]|uniref:Binding-protein-dependent transport systems inner membrane component n=1 Tax=Syntrophobotulus glycolicus (strain DSM 8271 / FlGlyR) TaxID=645991 RepID=F0SYI1_SYNGF|nr:ABC transporter permease [Syntrophobotulus glycolicus]ADY57093.1 binding-protein-dependent transport systems inner membrane component [Syntrophobotulus glycolicus DSM 8271]